MSLITSLYNTYNNLENVSNTPENLLPIAHSTQNAQIEVSISFDGNYISSDIIDKKDAVTLIPVTESSSSRSSGYSPHPLCDKLQYIAGDYSTFGGKKGDESFDMYINQLKSWCESNYSDNQIKSIYLYLCKKTLISDLVKEKILFIDENGKLLEKWNGDKNSIPEIFKVCNNDQSEAFVRFRVGNNERFMGVWQDKQVINDYINYYLNSNTEKKYCYIKGEKEYCSVNHPLKIRNTGDRAKLISANDTSGYTYRGRFLNAEQAFTISYEVSQKAHNALKYLIATQGIKIADRVYVLWGTDNEKTPDVFSSTYDFLYSEKELNIADTKKAFADELKKAISGYKVDITNKTELILAGFDAATIGRLSVTFYREYKGDQGNELIDNIEKWHSTGIWRHSFYSEKKREKSVFYGVPSLKTIATYALGTEQGGMVKCDDKLKKSMTERLLICVCDGKPVQRDIVENLLRKSFHPQNYINYSNWHNVVTIACSMYVKYIEKEREDFDMDIKECDDLSYNCGRLLAVADEIESWGQGDSRRQTNAMRFFTRFSEYPCETWKIINIKLIPYINALGGKANHLLALKEHISSLIDPDKFADARHLNGKMILGFDSQKHEIIETSKNNKKVNEEDK